MGGRPWEVVAALAALAASWLLFLAGAVTGSVPENDPDLLLFYIVGWTGVVLFWSWLVWKGVSAAVRYLKMLYAGVGAIILVHGLWQALSATRDRGTAMDVERLLRAGGHDVADPDPLDRAPQMLAAALLLALALLLHRRTVRQWVRSRAD